MPTFDPYEGLPAADTAVSGPTGPLVPGPVWFVPSPLTVDNTWAGAQTFGGPVTFTGTVTGAGGSGGGLVELVNTVAASGAAITIPDPAAATINDITLTANCTFTFPAAAAGRSITTVLRQDATGTRIVVWPATVKWPGAVSPALSTTPLRYDVLAFMCSDGTNWIGALVGSSYQ